jgi:predicted nucleic acid-binding protein
LHESGRGRAKVRAVIDTNVFVAGLYWQGGARECLVRFARREFQWFSEKKAGVLDELAAERASLLEKESAELEKQAQRLAAEIEELAGETPVRIG